jgi:integrase
VIVSEQGQELADGTRHYGPPKTAAGVRTVALPPHLVADVEDHMLRWVGPSPTDLLFTGPKATELYRATFNSAWDRARRAVGMDDFHFHDLRHTRNTLAAGTGASTKELMARMGHASARAALIYQHASEERDVMIAERLSAMTEEALKGSEGNARDDGPRRRSAESERNG